MRATYSIPILFVFLWSTAYMGFKLCADYAEPATFVLLRASIAAVLLIAIVKFQRLTWPERLIDVVHSSLVGILIHGVYAGGVFAALYHGVDAGVCALILGIQPLITTAISIAWLNESITWLKSTGILVGFAGVMLLVVYSEGGLADRVLLQGREFISNANTLGILLCVVALMAISIGMIYQKRYCTRTELLPGACIQYAAAAMFMLPFAMSNLFYLVPPLVAIEAWIFFDEHIDLLSVIAMLLCMSGVMLVGYASRLGSGVNRPACDSV